MTPARDGARGTAAWVLGLYCAAFVVPVRAATGVATVGPLDAFAFGFACWLLLQGRAFLPLLLRTPAALPLAAFGLVAALGAGAGPDAPTALKEGVKFFEAAALYFGFAFLVWRERDALAAPRAFRAWLATMCLVVLVAAAWQALFMRSVADPFSDPDVTQRYFRFGWGTFAASNYFAGMLLLFLPAVACRVSMPGGAAARWRALAALALLGAALVGTISRGALLAFALALVASVAAPVRGGAARAGLLVALAAAAGVAIAASPVGYRVFELAGSTLDELSNNRVELWEQAWAALQANPVLGVGLGALDLGSSGGARTYAHNALLQVAAETGLLGVSAYAVFLAALFWTGAVVVYAERRSDHAHVYLGLTLALGATLVHNMIENTLLGGVLFNFVFWPLQALLLARYWDVAAPRAAAAAAHA